MQLTYFGILRAPTSWAKVCRELVSALCKKSVDLAVFERRGFLFDEQFPVDSAVMARRTDQFRDDTVFTFEHPATYHYLKGRRKVGILTYESTVVPDHWIDEANKHLDLLLVSSDFCKNIFIDAGMDPNRLAVLHYGYNPDIFGPVGDKVDITRYTDKKFVFLNVASPHKRKGIESLLQAYANAFTNKDDVSLLVKVNYMPNPKKGKPFEYRDLKKMFADFSATPGAPEVILVDQFFSELELAALYRSCGALVSATRGEGFGMVFLEALACGLPVIVTGWSGHMDFLDCQNATLVDYTLRAAGEIQYDCDSPHAKIAQPDVHDLAKKMFLATSGAAYLKWQPAAPEYTWSALADHFIQTLQDRLG